MMNETVVMIGAGRVATHLAQALRERAQGGDAVPEAGAHAHVEPAAPAPAKKPRKARSSRKRSVSNAPTLLGDD